MLAVWFIGLFKDTCKQLTTKIWSSQQRKCSEFALNFKFFLVQCLGVMRLSVKRVVLLLLTVFGACTLTRTIYRVLACHGELPRTHVVSILARNLNQTQYRYNRNTPIVFVGGVPRSGTTLMRVMLDAHPDIRCGQETRVIPRMLSLRQSWGRQTEERWALENEGISQEMLDAATAAFLLEVIARHGEPARVLCNKDPFTLKSAVYLSHIFPNSKFLLMLRDGRASVHSMISRRVTIAGFNLSSYRDCLSKWSIAIEAMLSQCMMVGPKRCMTVRYEDLVLQPRATMQHVLRFLKSPWHEGVLHHEEAIGQPGGVSLSRTERSTDQVIKPVNLEALTRWVGHIPADVQWDIENIAPMLRKLGYNPNANPPDYGRPDSEVINNTQRVLRGDFKMPSSLKRWAQVSPKINSKGGRNWEFCNDCNVLVFSFGSLHHFVPHTFVPKPFHKKESNLRRNILCNNCGYITVSPELTYFDINRIH